MPQDLTSLNGKILKVDPATGGPWPGNPFEAATNPNTRLIWTYGHRNPQGLAYRSGAGVRHGMWSAEHGPTRDDEVNRLEPGGNYGWDPVLKPGPVTPPEYWADAPMTDHSLPGRQIDARWTSGFPTLATSGATWLTSALGCVAGPARGGHAEGSAAAGHGLRPRWWLLEPGRAA